MEIIWQIVEELLADYQSVAEKAHLPDLTWEIKGDSRQEERYAISYASKAFHIQASNPFALASGIAQIEIGAKSKHYSDFLGQFSPQFKCRPLWLDCDQFVPTGEEFGVVLPNSFLKILEDPQHLISVAKRVISLGYNAFIVGWRGNNGVPTRREIGDLKKLFHAIRSTGLKIFIKPYFSKEWEGNAASTLSNLLERVGSIDGLFCEAETLLPFICESEELREMTSLDQALYEIQFLEDLLGQKKQLIYFVPAKDLETAKSQAMWFPQLCDSVGDQTIMAFSAVAGDPLKDFLPPHPLWEELRQSFEISITPLMPVLNVGGINQGEGLWPILTHDLIDRYFSRCYRHEFAGILSLVNQLPLQGALLDCSLWVSGQANWKSIRTELLVESWFKAFKADFPYIDRLDTWKKMREVSLELSHLKNLTIEKDRSAFSYEECRAWAESLITRLNHLEQSLKKTALQDYATFFGRDGRRMVLHFLQQFNVSLGNMPKEEGGDSFWTHVQESGMHGLKANFKVQLLEKPNKGESGSSMHSIYQENRGFE